MKSLCGSRALNFLSSSNKGGSPIKGIIITLKQLSFYCIIGRVYSLFAEIDHACGFHREVKLYVTYRYKTQCIKDIRSMALW